MKKLLLTSVCCLTALAGCVPIYPDSGYDAPAYGYSSASVAYYSLPTYVRYGAPPNTPMFRQHDAREKMRAAPYWHAQHNPAPNTQRGAPRNAPAAQSRQGGHEEHEGR